MSLKVFNTMSRKKEEFTPRTRNLVKMYTCGLTVYDYMHVGHARTYLFWDVFKRYLTYSGYEIISVINYTDIDDKIIARANERGIDFRDLAEEFIDAFDDDCEALGILPYTVQCRATDYIPEMIEMVERLVEIGYGYIVDGDVFYDVHKFPRYGALSGHNLEDLEAGARVDVDERKKNPSDFALWKAAKPGEPTWNSPWGPGRPGWHIECSVMSSHFLGDRIDVHGGAVDNMFPHHENEIAQSEAYLGLCEGNERWCNYWMHPEHLLVENTKMSKSLGNFITVRDLLEDVDPITVRLSFLTTHYRTQMNFTQEGLEAAKSAYERILNFIETGIRCFNDLPESDDEAEEAVLFSSLALEMEEKFRGAMDDDLNCPAALGSIFDFIKQANQRGWESCENKSDIFDALNITMDILDVLGISAMPPVAAPGDGSELLNGVMQLIIRVRKDLRVKKDYESSDIIRDGLDELGIVLEDTSAGSRWRKKRSLT
ncbi:cysteine--tRNA ligase [bacterium]|nr:cysteine--tRNA ligase [bacterium]